MEAGAPSLTPKKESRPPWMRCVNAVVHPGVRALNEAVAMVADVTRDKANKLINMGAVWARMDTLTDSNVLDQYYGGVESLAAARYADLRLGCGSGSKNDKLYDPEADRS